MAVIRSIYDMLLYSHIESRPDSVLEAAQIDGAIGWNKLKSIILPLMMPVFTIGLFLSISNAFKLFIRIFLDRRRTSRYSNVSFEYL